ncbi:uncharacterized protein LOC128218945 [Mya arenaria]|uniref:uncharacterized protein LOC128218945 n=1 Tax=Mya arenaria TaxID=6604 RepID=UPI0022E00865|nr:uncharacterized protein LOC128218945 [Mya arenaria]
MVMFRITLYLVLFGLSLAGPGPYTWSPFVPLFPGEGSRILPSARHIVRRLLGSTVVYTVDRVFRAIENPNIYRMQVETAGIGPFRRFCRGVILWDSRPRLIPQSWAMCGI